MNQTRPPPPPSPLPEKAVASKKREDRQTRYVLGAFAVAFVISIVIGTTGLKKTEKKSTETAAAKAAAPTEAAKKQPVAAPPECRDSCLADRHKSDAERACKKEIERHARYQFEWTNWWVDGIWTKYVLDERAESIRYMGDKLKFQNGFGAWTIMTYYCTFSYATREASKIGVEAGQL